MQGGQQTKEHGAVFHEWRPISEVSEVDVVDLWVPASTGEPSGRIPDCRWNPEDNAWHSRFFPRHRFPPSEPTHFIVAPKPPPSVGRSQQRG